MRIDSAELRRRLGSSANLANLAKREEVPSNSSSSSQEPPVQTPDVTVEHRYKAKPHRGAAVPSEVKEVIGTLASLPLACRPTQTEIGDMFGFDQRQVSQFKRGAKIGEGGVELPPDQQKRAQIQERQNKIKDAALLRVMECLNLLTPEKLEDLDAKSLSKVSVDMSKVAGSFEERDTNQNINIVVYTPETRKETSYKTIEV